MNVRKASPCGLSAVFLLSFLLPVLAGCAARPAPDIRGSWTPVNRYQSATHEIPLRAPYAFYPTPMDRTLKGMLERWTRDMGMTLAYEHGSDFTLHTAVADLRTDALHTAVERVNAAYAPQRVLVRIDGSRLVVERAGSAGGAP